LVPTRLEEWQAAPLKARHQRQQHQRGNPDSWTHDLRLQGFGPACKRFYGDC
jgi:hypothetical protein